jgi:geranylgeranyl pyrophosphate synthase
VECGGICARASETDYAGLKHFAAAIGLAFQVIDDVLDVTNAEKKGRASDLENEKATYVALLGLEGAQNEADRLFSEAMTALDSYGAAAARLRSLSQKLVYRKT